MTLPKLLLVPDSDGYQSTDGNSSIYVALAGGAGRSRLDKIGAAKMVSCTWTLNRFQYQYWRAFYRTATKEASLSFLCDLLSEDGTGPVEHQCRFIPGSVTLPRQQGLTYVQQAQLEVLPLPTNTELDNEIISVYNLLEDSAEDWFNALEHLVISEMPIYIGA